MTVNPFQKTVVVHNTEFNIDVTITYRRLSLIEELRILEVEDDDYPSHLRIVDGMVLSATVDGVDVLAGRPACEVLPVKVLNDFQAQAVPKEAAPDATTDGR